MAKPNVIYLTTPRDADFDELVRAIEAGPSGTVSVECPSIEVTALKIAAHLTHGRAFTLSYKSGDRCAGCGRSAFHVGRTVAVCARCELPVPIG